MVVSNRNFPFHSSPGHFILQLLHFDVSCTGLRITSGNGMTNFEVQFTHLMLSVVGMSNVLVTN